MNIQTKKKMIQKIRNRMSAHRSRIRKGLHYKIIEKENKYLNEEIERTHQISRAVIDENKILKRKIIVLENNIYELRSTK